MSAPKIVVKFSDGTKTEYTSLEEWQEEARSRSSSTPKPKKKRGVTRKKVGTEGLVLSGQFKKLGGKGVKR